MPYNGHQMPVISPWPYTTANRLGAFSDSPIQPLLSAPYTVYGAIQPVVSGWHSSTADRHAVFSDSPITPIFSSAYTVRGWITDWWPFPPPDAVAFPPVAEFTWDAPAPIIYGGAKVSAPVAEFTWNAHAPVVSARMTVYPPAIEFTWNAPAPTVSAGAKVAAPATGFTWNAPAPVVSARMTVYPPAIEFTWNAPAPTVSAGAKVAAPAAEFTWNTPAPNVSARVPVYPPATEFTWNVPAPRWSTTRFTAGHSARFTERGDAGHTARFAELGVSGHAALFAEINHAGHAALFGAWILYTVGNSARFSILEFDIYHAGHSIKFAERGDAGHALTFGGWILETCGHSAVFGEKILDTAGHAFAFDAPAADLFSAGHAASFSAADGALVAIQTDCYVEFAGRRMEILSLSLRADAGGYCWAGDVEFARAADYRHLHKGDVFTLHLQGDAWALEVSDKSYSRQGADRPSLRVPFLSPTARLEREKISKTWPAVSALAAATEAANGVALDWRIADWQIPAGRLAFSDAPRIQVIQVIAAAVGGIVQTTRAGGLVVKYRYEAPVSQWATATPDNIYLDTADNLSYSESYRMPEYHGVFITDSAQAETGERQYASQFTATGEAKGVLRVYAWPWFADFEIVHTGPATLQVAARVLREIEVTEQVEFKEFAGETQYPVHQLLSVSWKYLNLGTPSWQADSRSLAVSGGNGYGLAEIHYIYRAFEYTVAGAVAEDVQFLVLEA